MAFIVYLVVGIVLARIQIRFQKNIIFDDSAIHTAVMSFIWAAIPVMYVLFYFIKAIDFILKKWRKPC